MKKVYLANFSVVGFGTRQRGASLLEGIAYLGIAALVILGAVSLLTSAFSNAQSNRGATEIVSIRTGVKKLYTGQANSYGTADMTAALNTAKIFPTTLTPSGSPVTGMNNSWGGLVTVKGTSSGATFTITYTLVPQDACISMVSGATGWTQIDEGTGNNPITDFPATPANANTLCANTNNSVNFTSR
jgi:hypothetical protein